MVEMISLWIPGRPVPYTRPRFGKGHTYQDPKYREWREMAAWETKAAMLRTSTLPFEGPVDVKVMVGANTVEVEVERSATVRPSGLRGDLDNYVKAVFDAITDAGLIGDDKQVTSLYGRFQ